MRVYSDRTRASVNASTHGFRIECRRIFVTINNYGHGAADVKDCRKSSARNNNNNTNRFTYCNICTRASSEQCPLRSGGHVVRSPVFSSNFSPRLLDVWSLNTIPANKHTRSYNANDNFQKKGKNPDKIQYDNSIPKKRSTDR